MSATIKDIAKVAGVSYMTVSRALNGSDAVTDETRERVLKIAEELNYRPNLQARSLVMNRKYSIGVVFSTLSSATAPSFMQACLNGIYQTLAKDYNLVIKDLERGLEHFNLSRVDGVIFVSQQESDDKFIDFALAQGTKLVVINRRVERESLVNVTADEVGGAARAVKFLIEHNCRRIALINGPAKIQSSIDRQLGYQQALSMYGMSIITDWVQDGKFSIQGGYDAMNLLLQHKNNLPDGVFCANDEMAFGALKAINEAGLNVPKDIAIIGFNDSEMCQFTTPALTTVRKPIEEMARLGAEALFALINQKHIDSTVHQIATELIIRASVR
ncbi:MAG: LacI family transcriptional regulator [Neisseriaceae bacterium]|nr:MAG: LacI family transcriptional regulator [Neisseriaceae bacterium]